MADAHKRGERLTLRGAMLVQRGQPVFVTAIRARDVVDLTALDTYDPETTEGYQRERSPARMREAAQYYRDGGRMPNPLLFNIREADMEVVEVEIAGAAADYEEALETVGNFTGAGSITIPRYMPLLLWLYDGQHREGALERLMDEEGEFEDFPVPVSITLGLPPMEEMKEFYEVNQNAKAVKTDLAWTLLRKRAEADPDLAELLDIKGRNWQTRGQEVVEELLALEGPWKGCIQAPNQRKERNDRLTINLAQFIRSLRPVLAMDVFNQQDAVTIARVLNAYWSGIARVLPEPFHPDNNPKDWVIQKGPGAISLHAVFPTVAEVLRSNGNRLGDEDAYAEVLDRLPELEGEVIREDGQVVLLSGADFWLSGPSGVASQFTGDAGRKRLGGRILALIPRPSIHDLL